MAHRVPSADASQLVSEGGAVANQDEGLQLERHQDSVRVVKVEPRRRAEEAAVCVVLRPSLRKLQFVLILRAEADLDPEPRTSPADTNGKMEKF